MLKKISIIVSLCLVGAIVITTSILSFVQKSYMPELSRDPTTIEVKSESTPERTFYTGLVGYSNKDKYDEMVTIFNDNMFNQSILNSMFTGNLSSEIEINYLATLPAKTGYRVTFDYQGDIILMQNGQEYHPPTDSNLTVKFNKIIFDIVEKNGFDEFKMYADVTAETGFYEIKTIANIRPLYDFLKSINNLFA